MKKIIYCLIFFSFLSSAYSQNFPIGNTTITFNDPTRTGGYGSGGGPGRQIQCEIYYPATSAGANTTVAAGTFPVVVFGHGFVMTWDAYQNIWQAVVPNGYIMVFPRTEGNFSPSHNDFALDLSLCVTKMQGLNSNASSLFYNHVANKSAIMGHSMGGGASILAAANNSTIETVIGLAPAETTPSAITAASQVSVPALIFSGSADGVTPPANHHVPIYNGLQSACKYFISITGGAHCYFANTNFNCDFGEGTSSNGISITRTQQHTILFTYLLPWLDYKLKQNCTAKTTFETTIASDAAITYQGSCNLAPFTITANGPVNLCAGQSVQLVAPYSVNWSDGSTGTTLTVSAAGTYYANDANCATSNSIVVSVTTVDASASLLNNTISANANSANYVWLDCNASYASIPGETSQQFTPNSNGFFAVEVEQNGCKDTSACVAITTLGITNGLQSSVTIFPNPFDDYLQIQFDQLNSSEIVIYNSQGKVVLREKSNQQSLIMLHTNLESGIYLLEIRNNNESLTKKLIKY